jgi:hypothetical protein
MIYPLIRYKTGCIQLLIAGLLLFMLPVCLHAQEVDYRAQSLYIYKFTKFIYWPESRKTGDFVIGVYGNSPIIAELQLMASLKKAAEDQDIVVKEIPPEDDLSGYHIIYVPSSKSRQIAAIASQVGNLPVLIVSEREGMAGRGATISFLIDDYEILKFEVNVGRLKEQKLSISDELVKLGYKL